MKKKILYIFLVWGLLLTVFTQKAYAEETIVEINEENFPDEAFREYLRQEYDDNKDGVFSQNEIGKQWGLYINNLGIKDLTGIKHFQALSSLYCQDNELEVISPEIFELPKLTYLDCSNNKLQGELDISASETLDDLKCQNNLLTSIKLNSNIKFGTLDVRYNRLADKNAVTKVVFSSVDTYHFWPQGEKTSVEISEINFPDENFRTEVKIYDEDADGVLSSEEIAEVTHLRIQRGEFDTLQGIEYFTAAILLECSYSKIQEIPELPKSLEKLFCNNNRLTSLPTLPLGLQELDCQKNKLTELPDLPDGLKILECGNNQLTKMPELSSNLETLSCSNNELTALPILPESLEMVSCSENNIKVLPLLPNGLKMLYCQKNELETLPDVPVGIETLYCHDNKIEGTLDVRNCKVLSYLHAYNNNLTKLILPEDSAIENLYVYGNKMTDTSNVIGITKDEWWWSTKDLKFCPQQTQEHLLQNMNLSYVATFDLNGELEAECRACGKKITQVLPKVSKVSLYYTTTPYNGKVRKPSVTVKDAKGKKLVEGKDYKLTYQSGRKNVGRYYAKVTLAGNYYGNKKIYFTIMPKVPTNFKAQLYGYDDIKLSWSTSKDADGYYVYEVDTDGKYTSLGRTTKTTYKLSNKKDGVKYTYAVAPYFYNKSNEKRYIGEKTKSVSITTLKKVSGLKVQKNTSKEVTISWSKMTNASGYQVSCSTSKTGTKVIYNTTSTKKIYKPTSSKTLYYKVRAYKTVNGKKIYAPWSSVVAYKRK